ncbi:hypothetical protein PIB30_058955 [Stylosanthes scabra]|uniref:Uncharacterized protein n=1 Tax=Stylosanthes scabra TaxID=79078 RepID=A0ABU6QKQ9_9FABA|nr:hypothetical protein [Stylosanthes scabra]
MHCFSYASFEVPPTSVEEETTLTNLVQNITTQQHDHVAAVVHFPVEDPPTSIEKELPFANIVLNIATQQHNYVLEDIQHDDAGIVEKEKAMTPLFQNITTQEHMPHEKQLEESVSGPELTLKDLALEDTAEHDITSEITIEKPLIAEEISKCHNTQATHTEKSDSQEQPILTQRTMDAIDEIYEKKLQIQQVEERLQQMLEDLRAMEPIDDSENLETPVKEETEEPKTPRKRLYKWATEGEDDIMYEFLFKFMTGKTFEAVREHFMSLAKKTEMDLAIMKIMCIFHNRKNNERFRDIIYCVPQKFMYHMLQKYHHKYFNIEIGRPYELSTMGNDDDLEYIIKDKMKKAHYVSSLIILVD